MVQMNSTYGGMINSHFVKLYRENFAKRLEKLSGIKTRQEALSYVEELRKKVKNTYRIPPKCDLNVRNTGQEHFDGGVMEKIIIDSRENFPVTMNLYRPAETKEKSHPAVLVLCGHSGDGKCCENYRIYAVEFARRGCIVLVPDPLEQGERYEDPEIYCCSYHNKLNVPLKAIGDHFGSWRLNDAIRSLDYLLSRPEVDGTRVGLTGNSGGGTMTTLLHAYDERLTASAPCCYITRWVRNVENELPVDAEQAPPFFAVDGGEMADLLLAQAPRPILISGNSDDFFDIRGTKEVYEEIRNFYRLLGAEEKVAFSEGPGYHGLNRTLRENAYEFFSPYLKIKGGKEQPEPELLPAEKCLCTPKGSILTLSPALAPEIIGKEAEKIAAQRPVLSDEKLQESLKALFHITTGIAPTYRQLRPRWEEGKAFSRFLVEEKGDDLFCIMKGYKKELHYSLFSGPKATLYVAHQDAEEELKKDPPGNEDLYGVDYRGIGETLPLTCDQHSRDFFAPYLYDYHYDANSWQIGDSMIGGRVLDILRCIELLFLNGLEELTLTASGIGIIPALFAAFLTDRNVKLELKEEIPTFLGLCRGKNFVIPQSMVPEGILSLTDLDDIAERLRKKGILS